MYVDIHRNILSLVFSDDLHTRMEHRHEIARLHEEEHLSERQIARKLRIAPSTVHYWLIKETFGPVPKKRGRPRVTDEALDLYILNASTTNPFMSAVEIRDELAPRVSVDTIRKRLKEKGMRCRIPARKPFLRPIHIQKRFQFAVNHIGWGVNEWNDVVFSDEKIFRASTRGPLRVYRPRASDRFDQNYIVSSSNPRGRFTVCVWMAFGNNFKYIHRIRQRTLNAEYYVNEILPIVEDDVLDNNLTFMHDLSPIHTSRLARHWLETHNITVMDDWPPKGPDMNPVENVWAELVRRTRPDSANKDQLWENILAAFNELDDDYFDNLIRSMPRRIAAVLQKRGGWTKY